jgi:hypothetical protein
MDEIIFASSLPAESRRIRRMLAAGALRQIAPRLYTSNQEDDAGLIVRRHLYPILSRFYPGAILSHRTALENRVSDAGSVYLIHTYTDRVELPGVTVFLQKGPPAQPDDGKILELHCASQPRALLENMQRSRTTDKGAKTLSREEMETWLMRICQLRGDAELVRLRAEAKEIAARLGMKSEYEALHRLIAAVMGTGQASSLRTTAARAQAAGQPYDLARESLFGQLAGYLANAVLPRITDAAISPTARNHRAFFEAYFSNYIEGTEFLVEEAEDIVFRQKIPANRPQDAHDVLGTYRLIANSRECARRPKTAEEFTDLLAAWHGVLMAARPEKNPGRFKLQVNRVGSRSFVAPELVQGTLTRAWKIGSGLTEPLARALFLKFVVTEVHPFDDGNGRISRLVMNAQLTGAKFNRIIVPQVFREDYLTALTALTVGGNPAPYVTALERAQQFTAAVDFENYEAAKAEMRRRNAFMSPHEAKMVRDMRVAEPGPKSKGSKKPRGRR